MKINFKYFAFLFLLALFVSPALANAAYLPINLLGQLDGSDNPVWTTNSLDNGSSVNNKGFNFVNTPTIDTLHHRLFLSDQNNNRVLVFNLDDDNNLIDRTADYVLGQLDFVTSTASTSQSTMSAPQGMVYDSVNNRLFVSDANVRILVFDVSTISNGMNASYVLGQADFTSSVAATTQNGLRTARGLEYDSENNLLFVAERDNHRISIFDVSPSNISNGMNASYALGQPDFITATAATTQNGLNSPQSNMGYDQENKRLFVGDTGNQRVMIFDFSSGITNNMNASWVLSQTDFVTGTPAVTQSKSYTPRAVSYDPLAGQLFVTNDQNANRILVFDVNSITNGENAIAVLGQGDFTSSVVGVSQSTVTRPYSIAYDSNSRQLYSTAFNGNRMLVFSFVKLSTTNPSSTTSGNVYTHTLSTTQSQGTVSYAITEGSLPTGLSLNTTTGEISGTPTVEGEYTFTVQATDDNGAIGYFLSQPQEYTLVVSEPPSNSSGSRPRARTTNVPVTTESVVTTPVQVVELITPSTTNYTFTRTLRIKDTGEDVKAIQQYLNTHGYPVAITGPGSLGNETTKFGLFTHYAVMKFQSAKGLTPDGIVGPMTRAFLK